MVAKSCAEASMTDAVWVGAVTLMLFGYLMYALLVPEKS
jgi:K+-transporting ATPase KdpF subunit